MGEFFKKHPDLLLVVLTVAFLAILTGFYVWGIGTLASQLNGIISAGTSLGPSGHASFKLNQAKTLDLKGLVQ